ELRRRLPRIEHRQERPSRGAGTGHLQEAPACHGGAVGLHQSRITHRRPPSYSWERRTDDTRRQKRLVFLSVWGPVCQAVFPPYPGRHHQERRRAVRACRHAGLRRRADGREDPRARRLRARTQPRALSQGIRSMRSRTSRSPVARTASLTRSPGVGPTASSSAGSAAIAISSMAPIPSPRTASWLTRTRSGAGRATMVPRTSYAAGRRTVPQMPAANADSRAMKSSATRTRRLIRLGALAGAEDPVGPPEILGRQDPLARAPFLEEGHGALVAGAE